MGADRRGRALAALQARASRQPEPRRERLDDWMRNAEPPAPLRPVAMAGSRRDDARAPPCDEARAQRDAHRRRVAHLRARHAEHSARADALRQDQPDAADGRARRADRRQRLLRRQGRDRRAGARALGRHGLPAVHQLPEPHRLREHRLAAPRRRREEGGPRPARARDRGADEARRRCSTASRSSFPAASSSGPRSPAPSSSRPTSCSSTSRSPTSTTSFARSCARSCRASSPPPARSSSTRPPSRSRRCFSAARPRRSRRAA